MIKSKKIVKKRTLGRKVINAFILAFAALVSFLIFFFGFSQTSTFRNYLKESIISEVNNSVNGDFNIEELNGSILTSIILKNTSLVLDKDTLFKSENISIKLKPHKLLFDVIYVRQLSLFDAEINIFQDENELWNINKLAKSDTTKQKNIDEVTQDSSSAFPYAIKVDNLELTKINFTYKTFEFLDSSSNYDIINWNDMEFKNVNFSASAFADIKNSKFNLDLRHFSFTPNANNFRLNHMSGNFQISSTFAEIEDFMFLTDSTEIKINTRLEELNLLGDVNLENFKNYPLSFTVSAPKVHFDDLTYFIGSTDILKGTPSIEIDAKGFFGDFVINQLSMSFSQTNLEMSGRVQHLHTPQNLYITATVKNSTLHQPDADRLLPKIGIPVMSELTLENFEMNFKGEPINFNSTFSGNIKDGKINGDVKLDLTQTEMIYDGNFKTVNLDLHPIIDIKTNLTSNIKCKGIGVNPQSMNADFYVEVFKSSILEYSFDSLYLNLEGRNKKIVTNIETLLEKSNFVSENTLDFSDTSNTGFEFLGSFDNLNLAEVFNDSSQESNLSLSYNLSGNDLDLSKTVANLNFEIENSIYQNRTLDYSELDFIIDYDQQNNRNIQLFSEILDLTINGKYDLQELINLASYESEVISTVMLSKLTKLNPLNIIKDSTVINSENLKYDDITKSYQKADFTFSFKNSDLTQFLLGGTNISLAASGNGYLENDSSGFSLSNEIELDHFTRISEGNPIYVSDLYLNLHLTRNNDLIEFKELFGNLSIEGKRIYAGSEIANIESEVSFNADKMYFDLSSNIDTLMNIAAEGLISMSDSVQEIELSNLNLTYNQSGWTNKDSIKLTYKPLSFEIENFNINSSDASLKADGVLYNFGEQRFEIKLQNFENDNLSRFLTFLDDPLFNTKINSEISLEGSFDNPIIIAKLEADSLRYGTKYFGSVKSNFSYINKILTSNIDVVDNDKEGTKPTLNISSTIPVNLSFNPVPNRLIENDPLDIHLISTAFNLNTFGNVLPVIKNPKGLLLADVKVGGTFSDIQYSGFAKIQNSSFTMDINNLDYYIDFKINFDEQNAVFENLSISNTDDVKTIGTLNGSGSINFKGMAPEEFNILLDGDISVLAQKSKLTNTNYFGDLFVATRTPLSFEYNQKGSSLTGELLLRDTDILYSLVDETNVQLNSDITYKYKIDSTKIDREELRFKALLSEVDTISAASDYKFSNFNFNLGFEIESSARLVIVLPNLLNQKLFIEAAGGFTYASIDNVPRAQGTINLQPGSTLDFFKTFDAEGSLRFESELSNPFLDINATYISDYIDINDEPDPVAVRIKIQGPLENLGESLSSSNENISVQRGNSNIQNNIKDARYDFSDALTFLAFNKFKEDLGSNDTRGDITTNFATSAGMSLAGTFLTDLVNSSVGGVINNIQLSQRARDQHYLYSLSGKFKDFRYSFGGAFIDKIDPGKLEIKVEYLFSPNLSIRGEQRKPIGSTNNWQELIQELALKYNIEF